MKSKTIFLLSAVAVGGLNAVLVADFEIVSSELIFEGDSGPDFYWDPLPDSALSLNQDFGYVNWSGIGAGTITYQASGGDYYTVDDWGDPWGSEYAEYMQYTLAELTMTFTITKDMVLNGYGNLGFILDDGVAAALESIEDGFVLSAGTYTLQVADFGFGDSTSSWNNTSYYDEFGDYYYDYSGFDHYDYWGGFSFDEIPAPSVLGLFAIAGVCSRRRR